MGTRNLVCVTLNGEYKVAQYGQWDGYPDGQGKTTLEFCRKLADNDFAEAFKEKLKNVSWITEEEFDQEWVECGANPGGELVSFEVSDKHTALYPWNSRDTGAKILELIANADKPLKIKNSFYFAGDSLFCEWAWVVDLDNMQMECYKGFNKEPVDPSERFAHAPLPKNNKEGYRPVKHVITFPINNLPTDEEFFAAFNKNKEEEEEEEETKETSASNVLNDSTLKVINNLATQTERVVRRKGYRAGLLRAAREIDRKPKKGERFDYNTAHACAAQIRGIAAKMKAKK